MQIVDASAFLPHKKVISFETKRGILFKKPINFNIKTKHYLTLTAKADKLKEIDDLKTRAYTMAEMVQEIIGADHTIEWIMNNVSATNQSEIINALFEYIEKTLSEECYRIPNIEVNKKNTNSKYQKERDEKRKEITKINEILQKQNKYSLMDDIVLVMKKTGNTYKDILDMPIFVYRCMVRSIALNDMRSDDDYNLAYLKYKMNEYKEKLSSGEEVISQPQNRGANLNKIKAFLNK